MFLFFKILFRSVLFITSFSYLLTVEVFRSITLWGVIKLLNVTKSLDHFISSESIDDANTNPENKAQSQANSANKNKLQQKGVKVRQRFKKSNEDPQFSTSLKTPIENIIEETINEESGSENTDEVVAKKKGKQEKNSAKGEDRSSKKNKPKESADTIGYSFFNLKSVNQFKSETKERRPSTIELNEQSPPVDDIGFSFLPVREKGRKYKLNKTNLESKESNLSLNAAIDETVNKQKHDLSKSSIIDHYQTRKRYQKKQPESKESINKSKKLQSYLPTSLDSQLIFEKQNKVEYKESKKVSSNISYASILTNNTEESTLELSKSSNSLESENTYFVKESIDSQEKIKEFSSIEDIKQNLVESNSSSIEVLNENDTQSVEESTFEFVEKKLNIIVKEDQELERRLTRRSRDKESSSICIIDNQSEFEDTEDLAEEESSSDRSPIDVRFSTEENTSNNNLEKSTFKSSYSSRYNQSEFEDTEDLAEEKLFSDHLPINVRFSKEENESNNNIEESTFKSSYSFVESVENSRYCEEIQSSVNENYLNENSFNSFQYSQGFESVENHILETESPILEEQLKKVVEDLELQIESEEKLVTTKDITRDFIEKENCVKKSAYITTAEEKPEVSLSSQIEQFIKEETELQNQINLSKEEKAEMDISKMQQTRVLTLNDHEHQECTLYRIEKNWIVQFRLGPSLFGRKVYLYCNFPSKSNKKLKEFKRSHYQLLEWATEEGCENADDTASFTQIRAEIAGSFHYYFTYEKGENFERQGSGYFLVDPILKYGNNEDLPLDCIQCQTVLGKCLGSFSSWEQKLQVSRESGYNVVHFTPIQELGDSNSGYSLSEQLKLNPVFKKANGQMPTFKEVEQFVSKMRTDWKVASICDIVLNHTANESKWIEEHPEVTYNCINCPYMRPAYLLDAAFDFFSAEVNKGVFEDRGIPPEINSEDHLNAIRYHFRASVLEPMKIHELFISDATKYIAEFLGLARTEPPVNQNTRPETTELKLIQDPQFRRLSATVDMKLALELYNVYWTDTFDEDSRLKKCSEQFKSKLDQLNNKVIEEINEHLTAAIENVIAGIRYFRVQNDGPKFTDISIKTPLVYRYFTDYGTPKTLKDYEDAMYSDKGKFLMAHNGWVMSSDPLKNFAASDSKVYLRRELIAWGDSVKLRYGDKPEDCPYLWEHMRKYVEQTAQIFDGVRLDNCHSTPMPVAEYLLDCARRVRPDLYVVAELFTNSDMTDNIFVNRLGITSLIREALNAWDSHEQGRLVHRFGGSPVGSFYQPNIRPLVPSIAHALFLDQTHDNPSPVEKRSVYDLLPSTALVNMACCASGSNRGYDELVPHHIHVVDENREYSEWTEDGSLGVGNSRYVTSKSGIISAKKALNDLHFRLGKEGFSQVYVDQIDPDIVAVTRHCPVTHQSYILVAFTAFSHPSENSGDYQRGIKPLRFEGVLEEIVLEASLHHVNHKNGKSKFIKSHKFFKDSKWINGFSEYQVTVKQHIQVAESDIFEKVDSGTPNVIQLNFKNFKPGSIVVVRSSLPEAMSNAIKSVRNLINNISITKPTELSKIIDKMTLADLNRTLYRCDQEERDEGFGFATYNIPNYGSLVYAGLQGMMSLLANIRPNNDLGHPMCANLRDGNWMLEYVWKRLKLDPGTQELGQWIEENTKSFTNIPRYLVPCYFDIVVTGLYVVLLEKSHNLMSNFIKNGSTFVRGLALGSLQCGAYIKSSDLPTLSPNLAPPKPPTRKVDTKTVQACVTLSAGLPHFSIGYMRNWGRDTFIALRGLFILTGRYQEAREHILGYAGCLRHGLIPNLLDGGRNSRFNCRDAIWWWLYCIKEYVTEAPNGINILSDNVSRIFPTDDSENQAPGAADQPLYDVIQEALKVHFQGLAFRERNAGRQIDEHMTDQGFNNQIGVHPETGFVFGGNKWNCGTWMDKMGSSDKAGNRGKPATPRDGSAVELVGLSKSCISWLAKLNEENKYPYKSVARVHKNGSTITWTFKEWAQKIQTNFEKHFWVNFKPTEGEIRPDLINKRGIYKDSHGSSNEYTDFQLRCNFPIAIVAAPELFSPTYVWEALKQTEKYLLGPLGMKTLDPEDWAYRGDYDNSNQSDDATVAHGFNYHQGPEWVWPVGFFLRAKLLFAAQNGALKETLASTKLILSKHFVELQTLDWRGLPELTNSNGSYCSDSSRTQAWSMSCILEVLHDLQRIESKMESSGN